MTMLDWDSPAERTLQYLAASTPEFEEFNRILLIVHGLEDEVTVTLPEHVGVTGYTLLWDSSHDDISQLEPEHAPGGRLCVGPASMLLFRAHGEPLGPGEPGEPGENRGENSDPATDGGAAAAVVARGAEAASEADGGAPTRADGDV